MGDPKLAHWFQKLEAEKAIIQDVDGFYVYWPESGGGFLNEYALRGLADYLEEKNKPWTDQINDYFEKQSSDS